MSETNIKIVEKPTAIQPTVVSNELNIEQKPDFTSKDGVRAYMSGSSSATDWDNRYDELKAFRSGFIPRFWQELIESEDLDKMVSLRWEEEKKS